MSHSSHSLAKVICLSSPADELQEPLVQNSHTVPANKVDKLGGIDFKVLD